MNGKNDFIEALDIAIDIGELVNFDIVAKAYQQRYDYIVKHIDDMDLQDYFTSTFYVYANYLDSYITYTDTPDAEMIKKIKNNINDGQALELFEEINL